MSILTSISPRFEIRKLGPEHMDWAKAIATHTNVFHSPLWPIIYPDNKTERAYALYKTVEYLIQHQIDSGLSYGVFDKEYEFKRPESAKTGGAFYWDFTDTSATSKQLLEQMDFPLVSIALALDASNPLDMSRLKRMVDVLPFFATGYHHLHELYTHDRAMFAAKGPGEVMLRNGTSTRADYEGCGTMKKMAHFLMHEAASRGFRGIKIEAFHPAVHHVWMNPPAPFKATLLAMFNVKDYEEEVDGKKVVPYPDLDLDLSSIAPAPGQDANRETYSVPSADLVKRLAQVKKAAIDGKIGTTTVLDVTLVDVEMIERTEKKSSHMNYTSFAHDLC